MKNSVSRIKTGLLQNTKKSNKQTKTHETISHNITLEQRNNTDRNIFSQFTYLFI